MRGNFAPKAGLKSFLRKLAVALPANLLVFWLILRTEVPAIVLFGIAGGVLGALLLMLVQSTPEASEARPSAVTEIPRREAVQHLPHYPHTA